MNYKKLFILALVLSLTGLATAQDVTGEYNKYKPIEVTDTNDAGATIQKAQYINLACGNGDKTGTGTVEIPCSDVDSESDIALTDTTGDAYDYEIESFNLQNGGDADIWVYKDSGWVRDNSEQLRVYYGDNDISYEDVTGTWSDTDVEMVQHLQDDPLSATDSTANNNDGTVSGASSTSGEFDGAGSFDGTDDYIDFGDIGDDMSAITTALWMNTDSTSQDNGVVFGKTDDDSGTDSYKIDYRDSLRVIFISDTESTGIDFNTQPSQGTWFNLGFTWSSSSESFQMYTEGSADNSASVDGNNVVEGSASLKLGLRDIANTNEPYSGDIDAVRLYSDEKDGNWWKADLDASPKGNNIFFNQLESKSTNNPPSVNEINTNPSSLQFNQSTDVSANVTDVDSNLDSVWVEVYEQEEGTTTETLIANETLTEGTGDIYNASNVFTPDKYNHDYDIEVYANDTAGETANLTTGQFLEYPSSLIIDSAFDGSDLEVGSSFSGFAEYNFKKIDGDMSYYGVTGRYEVTSDNTTNTYRLDAGNISMSSTSVGNYNNDTLNFNFENTDAVDDATWDALINDLDNYDNLTYTVEFTAYDSNDNELNYTDYPQESNTINFNYQTTSGVFLSALTDFYNALLKDPINAITSVLNDILDGLVNLLNNIIDAIISLTLGLVDLIIYLITILLQVILDIVMYIVNGVVNSLQFIAFFYTDFDYEVNGTTYDNLSQTDESVITVLTGDVKVIEGETQLDEFDSGFSLVGKSMLTYTDSLTIYEFQFLEIGNFFSDYTNVSDNTSVKLDYDPYELINSDSVASSEGSCSGVGSKRINNSVYYFGCGEGTNNDQASLYRIDIDSSSVNRSKVFSPNDNEIYSGRLWDYDSGEDRLIYATTNDDGNIRLGSFNTSSDSREWNKNINSQYNSARNFEVSNEGSYFIFFNGNDNEYDLYDADSQTKLTDLQNSFDTIRGYDFGQNEEIMYVANGTHVLEYDISSTTVTDSHEVTNAQDVSTSDINNQIAVNKGDAGFTVYDGANWIKTAEFNTENISMLNIAPVGDKLAYQNDNDAVKVYDLDNDEIDSTVSTQKASNLDISQNGQLLTLERNEDKTDYYDIYYFDAKNKFTAQDSIELTLDYAKPFDPVGYPFGTLLLSGLITTLIGAMASAIPDSIIKAISTLFKFGFNVVLLAIEVIVVVAEGINFIFNQGLDWVKWVLYGYVGLKVLKYWDMYSNKNMRYTAIINEVVHDIEHAYDRTVKLTAHSYDILDKSFHTLVEILKTVKQYIPFI